MARDPSVIERGIHVLSVAKWLERMADHATNLAEQVIFMVRGTDIRHAGKLQLSD
jgi:phosphate transport system protein